MGFARRSTMTVINASWQVRFVPHPVPDFVPGWVSEGSLPSVMPHPQGVDVKGAVSVTAIEPSQPFILDPLAPGRRCGSDE